MKVRRFDKTGKAVGEVQLPEAVFGGKISKSVIHTALRSEQRNRRQGTHQTKGFSDVSGGGKKPWGQKHTGNARQGSTRAPQWRHGATVHGPKPRDYSVKMNRELRKKAIASVFGLKGGTGALSVMEDMQLADFSTKTVFAALKTTGLIPGNTVAYVVDSDDIKLKKSFSNIPVVRFVHARRITIPELFNSSHVVVSDSALKYLSEAYGAK